MTSKNKTTILLVEDEATTAILEKKQLMEKGYLVHHVNTGEKAVAAIIENDISIDLVLIDIDLGPGIDGTQAAQEILKEIDIPVVFLSSHTEPEIVEKTEKITSYGYVVKNSGIVVLDASIKMALKLFNEKMKNKQADIKLRESEQRLRSIFNSVDGVPLQGYDKNRRVIFWNPASEKIYGYTKDEAMGRPLEDLIIPEKTRQDVIDAIREWHDHDVPIPAGEIELLGKNSKPVQVYSNHVMITNYQGEKEMFCIDVDLTERKQAEEALRKSEEKFRSFIENANDIIYQVSPDGTFTYASTNWIEILGYQIDEVINEKVEKFVHPDDLHLCIDFLNLVLTTGMKQSGVEYRVKHKNGAWRWHNSNGAPIKDEKGKVISYMGIARDVTESKEKEQAILKLNERYKKAQEMGIVGNWEFDIQTGTFWGSEQAKRIYGLNPDEDSFTSEVVYSCIPEKERIIRALNDLIEKEKPFNLEHEIITFDNKIRKVISTNAELEKDGNNNPVKIAGVIQDITKRVEYEKELVSAKEKAEESEDFLNRTGEMARVGGWYLKDKFDRVFWTRTTGRIHELPDGYNPPINEAINYYHQEDKALVKKCVEEAIKEGKPFKFETRLITAKGNLIWVQALGQPEMRDGKCVRLSGTFQDITERKKTEEEIKSAEHRFRALIENAPDAVVVVNRESRFLYASPNALRQFGYSEEDLGENNSAASYTHPDDLPMVLENLAKVSQDKDYIPTLQYRFRRKDGKYRWVETTFTNLLDDPAINGFVLNSRDITEKKKAEEALWLKNLVFDASIAAMSTSDTEGTLTEINKAFLDTWNYSTKEEVIGKPISHFIQDPEQAHHIIESLKNSENWDGEFTGIKSNGSTFQAYGLATVLRDKENNIIGYQSSVLDITGRKKSEEELHKIEWLLNKTPQIANPEEYGQPYGDLTELNSDRTILNAVGKEMLKNIVNDYLGLLETSAAIYEKNGDYALGIFSSGWCKLLDSKARELTGENDLKQALDSGKWLCHESCWNDASLTSVKTGKPADIPCSGGINIYAYPIYAFNEVVGSLNFGYGNPPNDMKKLTEISKRFNVPVEQLKKEAIAYNSRPYYIVELAKEKIKTSARIIGTLVELSITRKQLQESERKLLEAQELSHIGNWEYIIETDMVTWSKELFNIFERSYDMSAPRYSEQKTFYTEESFAKLDRALQDCIENGISYELELDIITSSGSIKQIISKGKAKKDDKNKVLGAYGTAMDITERKRAEHALRDSERRLSLATKSAGVGIWDWDIPNNEMIWDERIFQMYGITDIPELVSFEFWQNCLHPDDREFAAEFCLSAVRGEKDYDLEFRVQWTDGSIRWIKGDAVVIRDDKGKPIRMIGTNYDITERKKSEEQKQEQLTEKEILLREVHHRVKKNISNIEGLLYLQSESTENSEAKTALLDSIAQVQSMRILYDNLLISKEYNNISIKRYIEDIIDSIPAAIVTKQNISIKKNIDDFELNSQKAILIGIIINELLTNVFKYAFQDSIKGIVSISIKNIDNMVTMIIEDNGIGIEKRISENNSPGFGLTIVKMQIEQLGGTYEVGTDNGTRSVINFKI